MKALILTAALLVTTQVQANNDKALIANYCEKVARVGESLMRGHQGDDWSRSMAPRLTYRLKVEYFWLSYLGKKARSERKYRLASNAAIAVKEFKEFSYTTCVKNSSVER